jgi:hypothetical protein
MLATGTQPNQILKLSNAVIFTQNQGHWLHAFGFLADKGWQKKKLVR